MEISDFYFIHVDVFIISYDKPKFTEKSFGKTVFRIFAKIEMTRNENRSFGCYLETVIFFVFCFRFLFCFVLFCFVLFFLLLLGYGYF